MNKFISMTVVLISMTIVHTVALAIFPPVTLAGLHVIDLEGLGPSTGQDVGKIVVISKAEGPDRLFFRAKNLPEDTLITVFLTASPIPGTEGAAFIGAFMTDSEGEGRLRLKTEIVDAYLVLLEGSLLGDPAHGDTRVPLNFFRGYENSGNFGPLLSLFGVDEGTNGGAPVFSSTVPLP